MTAGPRKRKNEENKERTPPAKRTEAVKRYVILFIFTDKSSSGEPKPSDHR